MKTVYEKALELIRDIKYSVKCNNWHSEVNYWPGMDFERWKIETQTKELHKLIHEN